MIKLEIRISPRTLSSTAKGNLSKNTYKAVEILSPTAAIKAVSPKRISRMVVPPNAENQRKVTSAGRIKTQRINSLIVLPFEIRAINVPTKGDHEIHHPQYIMVLVFCQSVPRSDSVQVDISTKFTM